MSYTLAQLRAMVALAEEGHFGRAAERLWMTQPPLSRRIKKLEEEIGVKLFERAPHAVHLTVAGRVFLTEARKILTLADNAPLLAKRVARGEAGTVRLGFTAMSALIVGDWLRLASEQLPGVDIQLLELVTNRQIEGLLANEVDIGLVRGVPSFDVLDSELIHSESLILAVPKGHPLMQRKRNPTIVDIAKYDVVTYSPTESTYLYQLIAAAFASGKSRPRYVQYVQHANSVLATVNSGLGVALVPRVASALKLSNVEFLEVDGIADFPVEAHCTWRRDHGNPAVDKFLRVMGIDRDGPGEPQGEPDGAA